MRRTLGWMRPWGVLVMLLSGVLSVGAWATPNELPEMKPPTEGLVFLASLSYDNEDGERTLSLWQDRRVFPQGRRRGNQIRAATEGFHVNRLLAMDSPSSLPAEGKIAWHGLSSGREAGFAGFYRSDYRLVQGSEGRTLVVKMLGDMGSVWYEIFEIDKNSETHLLEADHPLEQELDWESAEKPVAEIRQLASLCMRDRLETRADEGGVTLMAAGEAIDSEPCPDALAYFDLDTNYLFDLEVPATYDDRGGLHPLEAGSKSLRLWLDRRGDPRLKGFQLPDMRLQKARELGLLIPANRRLLVTEGLVGPPGEASAIWIGGTTVERTFRWVAGRLVKPSVSYPLLVAFMYGHPSVVQFEVFRAEPGSAGRLNQSLEETLPWAKAPTLPWTVHRRIRTGNCDRNRLDVETDGGSLIFIARHSDLSECPPIRSQLNLSTLEWTDLPPEGQGT